MAENNVRDASVGRRRKRRIRKRIPRRIRKYIFITVLILLVFYMLFKNIISLELEHKRLVDKNEELQSERRHLKIELKNVNSKEYIEEQARQQLRMVDPNEIIFVFPDDKNDKNNVSRFPGKNIQKSRDAAGHDGQNDN